MARSEGRELFRIAKPVVLQLNKASERLIIPPGRNRDIVRARGRFFLKGRQWLRV